jgi:hypothetical protein
MIPERRVKESHDDVRSHCDPELTRVVVVYLGAKCERVFGFGRAQVKV